MELVVGSIKINIPVASFWVSYIVTVISGYTYLINNIFG